MSNKIQEVGAELVRVWVTQSTHDDPVLLLPPVSLHIPARGLSTTAGTSEPKARKGQEVDSGGWGASR